MYENFHSILSILSYMLKAPLSVGKPVNSLFRQRNAIENLIRACVGLPAMDDLLFHKLIKGSEKKDRGNNLKKASNKG